MSIPYLDATRRYRMPRPMPMSVHTRVRLSCFRLPLLDASAEVCCVSSSWTSATVSIAMGLSTNESNHVYLHCIQPSTCSFNSR